MKYFTKLDRNKSTNKCKSPFTYLCALKINDKFCKEIRTMVTLCKSSGKSESGNRGGGRICNGAQNKKDGLKESELLKAEFHLTVTYLREIFPQFRDATRNVAKPINNVSA